MARRPNDRPARPLGKRLIASLLAVTLATTPLVSHPADLNAEMQAMFNDLKAPGQRHHAGRIPRPGDEPLHRRQPDDARPGRNYPLATIQLPSLRAGCGGIDIYGGRSPSSTSSSSSPAAEHRRQRRGLRLQAGAAVDLPDIDKLLTELQDQINKINAMNINSCEAAQALVNGVVGEYDNSVMSGCANISQYLGSVSDRAEGPTCASNARRS